jgi:hypothetical protein
MCIKLFLTTIFIGICIETTAQIDTIEPICIKYDTTKVQTKIEYDSVSYQENTSTICGYFQVINIHEFDSFYMIFIKQDNKKYTISSPKTIIVNGAKVMKDSTYYFNLTPIDNLILTIEDMEKIIVPRNSLHIKYFGYTSDEIGELYTASNLWGLILKDYIDTNKK